MFLKNSMRQANNPAHSRSTTFASKNGHSLRLRLMFWYGGLLVLGLACFGLLVLFLASSTINANIQSAIAGETKIVSDSLSHELSWQPPYWPRGRLTLSMLDNSYSTAGITIEVIDT